MSNQHTPGTGIHPEDLNALTEYWLRETNYINGKVDEAFKSAQDDAYARGYRRGREDLIEIRKQRDELLKALKGVLFTIEANDTATAAQIRKLYADEIAAANDAIANVKGGA